MDTFEYKDFTIADLEWLSKVCPHKVFECDADNKEIKVGDE